MKDFLMPVYGPNNDFRPRLATWRLTPAAATWLVEAHAEVQRLVNTWGRQVFRDIAVWDSTITYIERFLPECENEDTRDAESGLLVVFTEGLDAAQYKVARAPIDNPSMCLTPDGIYWTANLRNDTEDFETEMVPWHEVVTS